MSEEREPQFEALLESVREEEPIDLTTPFAQSLHAALAKAIGAMRGEGVIEMEDADLEALLTELTSVALDSNSRKKLLRRVVYHLIHSDHVGEVYGTDDEISSGLRRFFEGD